MATYNAESALARLPGPPYARAEDEARSFLREVYNSPADLEVVAGALHVRINPLSAPRRSRALAALCADLNATETVYRGPISPSSTASRAPEPCNYFWGVQGGLESLERVAHRAPVSG